MRADQVLNPGDVRQLTVYAELLRQRDKLAESPDIMILYPFVGTGLFQSAQATTWNRSRFHLIPVRLTRQKELTQAIPRYSGERA